MGDCDFSRGVSAVSSEGAAGNAENEGAGKKGCGAAVDDLGDEIGSTSGSVVVALGKKTDGISDVRCEGAGVGGVKEPNIGSSELQSSPSGVR